MSHVIIGTGLAAVRAVEAIRASGSSKPIIMIGAERVLPYDRPPLSKGVLRGDMTLAATRIHEESFFREQAVELVLGAPARHLRTQARVVELENGRELRFDNLLIATGAAPRMLLVPGGHLAGVMVLRTAADALRLKTELARIDRLVVVGGGLVGLEVAAVARVMGKAVTVIEAGSHLVSRLLHGQQVASAIADLHRDHGAFIRTNASVSRVLGAGRVEEVQLSSGDKIAADLVLVAIGIVPAVGWLRGSGISVDDGVVTDATLQTNVPGIFAAGDVARAFHPTHGRHLRFETYASAHEQGTVAGRGMAGQSATANVVPGAGSEQYGVRLQVIGTAAGADSVVVRGSLAERSFVAFFLVRGSVHGAFVMNRLRELPIIGRLVAQRARVDERRIADESEGLAVPAAT